MLERLARLIGRQPLSRSVELDPIDQCLLRVLLRGGSAPFRVLHAEVEASLAMSPAQTVLALAKLERETLITLGDLSPGGGGPARYRLASSGRRVARMLPPDCHSRIDFRL